MCFSCFQREQRGEEEAATREPQKGPKWLLFSSSLSRFPERQGVAVNQGTAEENGLSEMILLSWNSRVSCGLESEFVKGTTDSSSCGSNSFARFGAAFTHLLIPQP